MIAALALAAAASLPSLDRAALVVRDAPAAQAPPQALVRSEATARAVQTARHALPPSRCSSFGDPQLVAEAALCPGGCPYSQAFGCGKMCVVAEDCAVLAPARPFADPATHTCRQPCGDTPIPGCARCASPGVCEACSEGVFGVGWLELSDGGRRCVNHAERLWYVGYFVITTALLGVATYTVLLWRRPAQNAKVLDFALRSRERNSHRGGAYGFWGPSVSDALAGCGVPLYFRALMLIALFAAAAGAVAALANPEQWTQTECAVSHLFAAVGREDPGDREGQPPAWLDGAVKETWRQVWGPDVEDLPAQLHHAPHRAVLFAALYLVLAVGGLVCYAWGRRSERDALHQDFALRLSNVPKEVTDPAELQAHVDAFGCPCVGVSICYDFYEHRDAVAAALASDAGSSEDTRVLSRRPDRGVQTDEALELTPALRGDSADHGAPLDAWLMPCLGLRESGPQPILGSGYAYAVFATPSDARRAQTRINARGAVPLCAKGGAAHRLRADVVACEPSEVYWENYCQQMNFAVKIGLGIVAIVATAVIWLVLAIPYAMLFVGQVVRPGLGGAGIGQEFLLGLMISGGNLLVALVIDRVAGCVGFYEKSSRDLTVLSLAFAGTLFNTLFDLAIIIVVAKGASLNAAFDGAEEGYPRVLAGQLYELIVPGYLFVPVLVVPVFERVLPFYLGSWLVRSKPRVLQRDADAALAHGPFDICWRYADVLNSFTLCLALFLLPSGNGWRVMAALAGCFALIAVLDRYVLLYGSAVTPYATPALYKAFWWLWLVPTAVLAMIVGFWAVHAKFVTSWWALPAIGAAHVAVFGTLLAVFSSAPPVREEQYATLLVRQPGSFFSTNPVLKLRGRVLGDFHGDDGRRLLGKP